MSIQFNSPFKESMEDKTRKYLLQGVKEELNSEVQKAKEEELDRINQKTEIQVLKRKKQQYDKLIWSTWPNQIAQILKEHWVRENKIRKDKELKSDPDLMALIIDLNNMSCKSSISDFFTGTKKRDILEYVDICNKLNKDNKTTEETLRKSVTTIGQNIFDYLKKKAQIEAKKIQAERLKIAKARKKTLREKFNLDKTMMNLAQVPLTIEDKIQEIKDMLDNILGRALFPRIDPENHDFDVDVLMAHIERVIQPALAAIKPLEDVGGKLPIIGDLMGIMSMLGSDGDNELTKEEIKKLIGDVKPEIPQKVAKNARGIMDDILEACATIPMILINLIFQMIDTIIGLFKQIAGIIGVPEIPFPLSLIPQAIEAVPKLIPLIWKVPQLMYALVNGVIKDKLAQAMAMSLPRPDIDYDMIEGSLVEDGDAEKPSQQSKPDEKKISYSDVVADTLEKVSKKGYDRTDITRVMRSYKEIYNGLGTKINKYTQFSGESKYDNLLPTVEQVVRTKATPEGFQKEAEKVFANAGEKGVKYDNIKKTQSVVGPLYIRYEKQIKQKEPNDELIIVDEIKP